MDDHGANRRDDDRASGGRRARDADQEYFWGGKPGEDFGPITPSETSPAPRERQPAPPDERADATPETDPVWIEMQARHSTRRIGQPLRPDGEFAPAVRQRQWGPLIAAVGALVLLGGLTAAVLLVIGRGGWLSPTVDTLTEVPSPAGAGTSLPATAAPSPSAPVAATTAPAGSPTPLTLGAPTPTAVRSPAPTRGATAVPARASPGAAVLPTPPGLVTPPAGTRFATSTPARLTTPGPTRTAPPVPTVRSVNFSTRVWSEQAMHRVDDDASICGQANTGATAELVVIEPDRKSRTLAEFVTPAERVCHTLKVDETGLYVLTVIVKDVNGAEIERQSAALWVSG